MGESRKVLAGDREAVDAGTYGHPLKKSRHVQPRISKLKFSTCVDSIKENFKKITGNSRNRTSYRDAAVDRDIGSKLSSLEDNGVTETKWKGGTERSSKNKERRSSFEIYLSTIPKLDPIDRTVGWVLKQPKEVEIVNENLFHSSKLSATKRNYIDEVEYDTSVSRCESERGTHGRGTPPTRELGQPRLDDLFRKLQMKQEREARRLKITRDNNTLLLTENVPTNHSFHPTSTDYGQGQLKQRTLKENVTQPRKLRADILHKNSFYYNQTAPYTETTDNFRLKTVTEHCCEWKTCTAKFLSNKDLLRHVQEDHISCLPLHISSEFQSQRQLVCQWRNCKENRSYPARYKLLLHLQRLHCIDRSNEMQSEEHQVSCRPLQIRRNETTTGEPVKYKLPQNQPLNNWNSSGESEELVAEITEHLSGSL